MTAIAALLKATPDEINTNCVVSGWVRTKRDSKAGFSFLAINDGSSFDSIQVVADQSLPNYQSEVLDLSTGCAVTVNGRLVASQGKGQSVEIQASEIAVLGTIEDPETYPIAKKRHSFEYLRTVAHLRPRTNTFGAVTRMRTTLARKPFTTISSPMISSGLTHHSSPEAIVRELESCSESVPLTSLIRMPCKATMMTFLARKRS